MRDINCSLHGCKHLVASCDTGESHVQEGPEGLGAIVHGLYIEILPRDLHLSFVLVS